MDDMLRAVYRGEGEKLLRLLQKNGHVNRRDREGRTLLMSAVAAGKDDIVRLLLDNGADPNVQDKTGFTALHLAAQDYRVAVVKLLLESGAKVDPEEANGNTPLFRAVMNSRGRGEVIELLLNAGADRALKNGSGVSPEDAANGIDNFDLKPFFK